MFTIIGGDGKEYGPVSAIQIRAWIAGGRANLDTKAKVAGSDEWRRLGDYPEFSLNEALPPNLDATSTVAPTSVSSYQLAGHGSRLGARVIDWAIEFICAIPGATLLGGEFMKLVLAASRGERIDPAEVDLQKFLLGMGVLGLSFLILLIIQVWLLSTRGQSIGKIILGIRIVKVGSGEKPGIVHAWALRELAFSVIGFVLGIIPLIGLLLRPAFHVVDWCFVFRQDRRCLHDLLASTSVVRK